MSFLSKGSQPPSSSGRINIFDIDYPFDRSSWLDVFSACAGRSVVVQNAFAHYVVRERDWFVDFSAQTLSFGEDAFPVQFIGSESSVSNSWMWGWNNINNFDSQIISLANEARSLGERWGLKALTTKSFELNDTYNAHSLAIVTTGISKGNYCYYIGPHENGAAVMAVPIRDERVFAAVDVHGFVDFTMSAIQKVELDHRIFAESLLLWNGTPFERDDNRIVAYFPQQKLMIRLADAGDISRITNITTI